MRRAPLALTAALTLVLLTACGDGDEAAVSEPEEVLPSATSTDGAVSGDGDGAAGDTEGADVTVALLDPDGEEVGTVGIDEVDTGTQIAVEVTGMPPGFHGFHLHGTGLCEPDSASPTDPTMTGDFLSAGGHLAGEGEEHGAHAGDLPPLLVMESGEGAMTVVTDAVTAAELGDGDGTAVMVHSDPDNFANVPERYAPGGPDEDTLSTGDAGSRLACGVVE